MIYTTETLREALSKYKKPNDKIHRMIREKKLFPITRGLYTTAPDIRCKSIKHLNILVKHGIIDENKAR